MALLGLLSRSQIKSSLLENNVCIYCTYLFLSFTTTIIIYLVLACIYKHINNFILFFKAHFRVYLSYILSRILTVGILVQEQILIGGQIRKIVQHILQKRFDRSRW